MKTLELICHEWDVTLDDRSPIEVPGVSREQQLPELFREARFSVGVEVGVEQGVYGERLCQLIPGLKLYAVDCWQAHKGYRDHVSQEKLDGFYSVARSRLAPYGCTLLKTWSVDAARNFHDGELDFVYIDANHDFANVVKDIAAWSPKVRKGGIIAGHDYILRKNPKIMHHVVQAVRGWTECYQVAPWFVLGRKEKRPGEPRDDNRSWMWVR